MRLTITRAVSGFSGSAMASASSSRPLPFVNGLPIVRRQDREEAARRDVAEIVAVAADLRS